MLTDNEVLREEAFSLYLSKRYQEAKERCIVALTANPWTAWPYYLIGLVMLDTGKVDEASVALERYLLLECRKLCPARRKATVILSNISSTNAPT